MVIVQLQRYGTLRWNQPGRDSIWGRIGSPSSSPRPQSWPLLARDRLLRCLTRKVGEDGDDLTSTLEVTISVQAALLRVPESGPSWRPETPWPSANGLAPSQNCLTFSPYLPSCVGDLRPAARKEAARNVSSISRPYTMAPPQ